MNTRELLKKVSEEDPKVAFEQYVATYYACFKPATEPGPYGRNSSSFFHQKGLEECSARLESRDTASVRAGAANGDTDDMIEYALRLLSGAKAPFDEDAAYAIVGKIVQDRRHSSDKVAIAANIACTCLKRRLLTDPETFDVSSAFAFAEMYERKGQDMETGALKRLAPALWKEYARFREETGTQKMIAVECAKCDQKPKKGAKLKKCAGPCREEKKPYYCGRECQKADWKKHRKWCKIETVESDEEWTSDSDREDWDYSEDDLDKLGIFK